MQRLKNFHEKGEHGTDILDQSLAIQNSLKSLDVVILEGHLRTHVADQFKNEKGKAMEELSKVFKKKQKTQ